MISYKNVKNLIYDGTVGSIDTVNNQSYPNFLKCNGDILNQNEYSELYSKVGRIKDVPYSERVWVERKPGIASGLNIKDIIYDGSIFILCGSSGLIKTSTDINNWALSLSGTSADLNALLYNNGIYLCGGSSLVTSTNTINWTTRLYGTTSIINDICYGSGLFLMGGAGGFLVTSTDAINWTSRTSNSAGKIIRSLLYNDGLYVYAGDSGKIGTSTDGINWSARISGTTSVIRALTYGNGLYVYVGDRGILGTSTDAINWTSTLFPSTTRGFFAVNYADGIFLSGDDTEKVYSSTDAINWTYTVFSPTSLQINTLSYGKGYHLVGTNGALDVNPELFFFTEYTYNIDDEFALPNGINLFKYNTSNTNIKVF